jgi:hypothetical protein
MCKYIEYETEIECLGCGKKYKKKSNIGAQMMAHSQYCPDHILEVLSYLDDKYGAGIESIYEREKVENQICELKNKYEKYSKKEEL